MRKTFFKTFKNKISEIQGGDTHFFSKKMS